MLSKNGILMFDIWQTGSSNKLPEYDIQTSTKDEIIKILSLNSLKIKKIYFGQTIIYHLSPYYAGLLSKFSKSAFFNKIFFLIDRFFFPK